MISSLSLESGVLEGIIFLYINIQTRGIGMGR